jgi:hypothetical protein
VTKSRWYLRLTQTEGQVGITLSAADDAYTFTARWPVDASGRVIAEYLHDLASDLEAADPDA